MWFCMCTELNWEAHVGIRAQAANLLVPVALSASHVAYSSIRLEPRHMILGHAAGVAARLAVESGKRYNRSIVSALRAALRQAPP